MVNTRKKMYVCINRQPCVVPGKSDHFVRALLNRLFPLAGFVHRCIIFPLHHLRLLLCAQHCVSLRVNRPECVSKASVLKSESKAQHHFAFPAVTLIVSRVTNTGMLQFSVWNQLLPYVRWEDPWRVHTGALRGSQGEQGVFGGR